MKIQQVNFERLGFTPMNASEKLKTKGGSASGGNNAEFHGCDGSEAHPYPLDEVVVTAPIPASKRVEGYDFDYHVVQAWKFIEWVTNKLS